MQVGPDLVLSPMAGYDSEGEDTGGPAPTLVLQTKSEQQLHRRRASGIQLTRTPVRTFATDTNNVAHFYFPKRAGDFGVGKLGPISLLNM